MKNKGELILKYHGEQYSSHEVKLPISLDFDEEGDVQMSFLFEFPESPTKETVVFNRVGNINEQAIMQPYGIEVVVPNDTEFYIHFMMVEELIDNDAEMYTAVAKFSTKFIADRSKFLIYNF
jgi:hypothetical protein